MAEVDHTTVVEATAESLDRFIPLLEEIGRWLWEKGVRQWAPGTFERDRDRIRFLVDNGCLLLAYQGQRLAGGCILTEVDPGWPRPSAEAMYLSSLAVARFAAGRAWATVSSTLVSGPPAGEASR